MALFNTTQLEQINKVAQKSQEALKPATPKKSAKSINSELNEATKKVLEYFKDSPAILIHNKEELHDYVTKCIESGYAGIDTETTGLDRVNDTIVGASLYYPGGVECYIPMKHIVPIFEEPYKGQLTYEEVGEEFQRFVDAGTKMIFANADFDLAMINKDLKVDMNDICYYDVILAWRCMKENEKKNGLKELYMKYVMRGKGEAMKFTDFFSPSLFPYSKPEIAKLYAANDAKITFELFQWQLPYITIGNKRCTKAHMEGISNLIWNVELPLIKQCQNMHRTGIYIDKDTAKVLNERYSSRMDIELKKLQDMVQDVIDNNQYKVKGKKPFTTGKEFNPNSPPQVNYLLYTLLKLPNVGNSGTGKDVLNDINLPITNQILKVRSLGVLINTFVKKLPNVTTDDSRIHAQMRQVGADCIIGNTIIPTEQGYFMASELCESAKQLPGEHVDISDVSIVNKDQKYESAESVIMYESFPTIRITTEMGFVLEGTENHPIMVSNYTSSDKHVLYSDSKLYTMWDGRTFKTLGDVEIGDIVEIPCNYITGGDYQSTGLTLGPIYNNRNAEATIPDTYTEEFAEFLGMYHADGAASLREGTYTIALSNDDSDVIARFDELAIKLFNVPTCRYDKQADKNEIDSYINCKRLYNLDSILSHGKQNKRIPSAIWKSPTSVINAYIKGLTLDSSVHIEKATGRAEYELSIINDDDARLVQIHLASQGILCGWGHNENKDFLSPRLKFNSDNYLLFCETIGFIESRKYIHTEGCKKNKYSRRRIGNSFRVCVKSIESSSNDVYDLHVPGTHSFISNGIISHNTGRMSSADPNLQNIPSHATDIRHMFRATPGYVLLSSDYSAQEPRITAYVSNDPKMIQSFKDGKDIYGSIASIAFNVPYESCLEFHPETGEYQAEGKRRRGEAKTIVLGICYGRSVVTIADQLYGKNKDMTDDDKIKGAQRVFDAVLNAFPNLRSLMINAQKQAATKGYVETILGRRRHIPEMMLPEFEFVPMDGYVNPDVDPLDASTLQNKSAIPERIVKDLQKEFSQYKYYGKIVKRTKALAEEKIRVINNRNKIQEASRKTVNSIIQGSAADQTKMAILLLENNEEWKKLGGRVLIPVHDELLCEVPKENWKEGGELLSRLMCEAADFLPFPSKCDVETTLRWYGLEYPCPYPEPTSIDTVEPEEIQWIQYHLIEMEYELPVFKNEDGSSPRGNESKGLSGRVSDEYERAIFDYTNRYRITPEEFIKHIKTKVQDGVVL